MKNIFLFFFMFTTVLNMEIVNKIDFTKEEIDDIVKNIKEILESDYCNKAILKNRLEKFGLDEDKKNDLYSQLINACNSSNNEDKELFIRTMYEFFKKEIEGDTLGKSQDNGGRRSADTKPDNGLGTYLCEKFMILLGYDSSDC